MRKNIQKDQAVVRFKHFQNSPYAVFRSLKVQINIGVLAVTSLAFANAGSLSAQTVNTPMQPEAQYELEEVEVTGSRGKAVCENDRLTFWRNETDEREWCVACP